MDTSLSKTDIYQSITFLYEKKEKVRILDMTVNPVHLLTVLMQSFNMYTYTQDGDSNESGKNRKAV